MNMDVAIEYLYAFVKFICLIGMAYFVGWCLYGENDRKEKQNEKRKRRNPLYEIRMKRIGQNNKPPKV